MAHVYDGTTCAAATSDMASPRGFLMAHPAGAYTVLRTTRGAGAALHLNLHVDRLALALLPASGDACAGGGGSGGAAIGSSGVGTVAGPRLPWSVPKDLLRERVVEALEALTATYRNAQSQTQTQTQQRARRPSPLPSPKLRASDTSTGVEAGEAGETEGSVAACDPAMVTILCVPRIPAEQSTEGGRVGYDLFGHVMKMPSSPLVIDTMAVCGEGRR